MTHSFLLFKHNNGVNVEEKWPKSIPSFFLLCSLMGRSGGGGVEGLAHTDLITGT